MPGSHRARAPAGDPRPGPSGGAGPAAAPRASARARASYNVSEHGALQKAARVDGDIAGPIHARAAATSEQLLKVPDKVARANSGHKSADVCFNMSMRTPTK